jgi:hypothetical protein
MWYPSYGRMGGPQSLSRCTGEKNDVLPPLGIEPRFLSCPARGLVTIVTELSRLPSSVSTVLQSSYMSLWERSSSVVMVEIPRDWGFVFSCGNMSSSPERLDTTWGPTSHLLSRKWGLFFLGYNGS